MYLRRRRKVARNKANPRHCPALRDGGKVCNAVLGAHNENKKCDSCRLNGRKTKEELSRSSSSSQQKSKWDGYAFLPSLPLEMKRQGITRQELADKIGATVDSVGSWAKKARCSPEKQEALAEALGVSVARLKREDCARGGATDGQHEQGMRPASPRVEEPKKPARPRDKRVQKGYAFLPGLRPEMNRQKATRNLLAGMVGSHADTVGAWSTQRKRCPPEKQKALAEALGVSVARLKEEGQRDDKA